MAIYNLEPIEKEEAVSEKDTSGSEQGFVGEFNQEENPKNDFKEKVEIAKENSYEKVLERAKTQIQGSSGGGNTNTSLNDDVTGVLSMEEEARIQKLVDIALEKGPDYAFRVAIKLDDMYALDMLHDQLSHKLYEELISKGFLKEE